MVFIGVSLAFVLERWGETRREQQQEQLYLENIHEEIKDDFKSLSQVWDYYKKKTDNQKELLKLLKEEVNLDKARKLLQENFFSNQLFSSSASTMESLKSSGEFKLLRNLEVKSYISKLLNMYFFLDRIGQMRLEMMHEQILPYVMKRIDFGKENPFNDLELKEPYFKNMIRIYTALTHDYTTTLELTKKRCNGFLKLLEKEYEFIQAPPPDREEPEPKGPEPGRQSSPKSGQE